jgi:MFS family permease
MVQVASVQPVQKHSTRRAVAASTAGGLIEWYDFILYGTVAALVFPQLFFPSNSALAGTLLTFSTFFVGFAARPLGAVIFGHVGDRVGRKSSLMATLLLMGTGTVGIGLIPTYDQIGIFAPVALVLMRTLQGVGMGGEWGGAVLMASESGGKDRSGFLTGFPQGSAMAGVALANVVVLTTGHVAGGAFVDWAWRLPFLASIVLILLGLWMRNGLGETTAFSEVKDASQVHKLPIVEAFRTYPVRILLGMFVKVGEMAAVFVFITFVFTYGSAAGFSQNFLLVMVAVAGLLSAVLTPVAGLLGDLYGARRVYLVASVFMIAVCLVYFAAIDSGVGLLAGAVILISLVPYAFMFASEATIITSMFPPEVRYSGSSLAFNLAGIIGGGPAPMIAAAIAENFESPFALSAYLVLTVLLGMGAAYSLVKVKNNAS